MGMCPILQPAFVISQCNWTARSSWSNKYSVGLMSLLPACHTIHSQILDGVSDLQGRAQTESGLMVEHGVPPHVQVPVHILVTPVQTCLMVKGSWQAATKPEIAWSLFYIIWVESRCRIILQICRRLLTVLKCQLHRLSLTSSIIGNFVFNLEIVLELTPNNAASWFCSLKLSYSASTKSVKRGMFGLDTNWPLQQGPLACQVGKFFMGGTNALSLQVVPFKEK